MALAPSHAGFVSGDECLEVTGKGLDFLYHRADLCEGGCWQWAIETHLEQDGSHRQGPLLVNDGRNGRRMHASTTRLRPRYFVVQVLVGAEAGDLRCPGSDEDHLTVVGLGQPSGDSTIDER